MEDIIEIWKDIPGYEGHYQISNLGKVKSLPRVINHSRYGRQNIKERILKPFFNGEKRGQYLFVILYKNTKIKAIGIHQLVAMCFLNHTPNGHNFVVDHINSIKTDNRLNNLRIVSNRENCCKEKRKNKGYSSKYIGVHKRKNDINWKAQIQVNGKNKYLGCFETEEDAHEAYVLALKCINENIPIKIHHKRKL